MPPCPQCNQPLPLADRGGIWWQLVRHDPLLATLVVWVVFHIGRVMLCHLVGTPADMILVSVNAMVYITGGFVLAWCVSRLPR